jgi:hypothetical protein
MFPVTRVVAISMFVALASGTVFGRQGPVARALAGSDEATGQPTSNYTLYIGPTDTGAFWTISGATSYDPDGDALSYRWICNGMKAGSSPNITKQWPAGEHSCTLTVDDGFSSDSATATLRVKVDAQPPVVTAPDDVVISATETGGARLSASSELADWLNEATAVDNGGGPVHRMTPMMNGAPINGDTLFAVGPPLSVTFRFRDGYDNVGDATAKIKVVDHRREDLFVATTRVTGFGTNAGVIKRVRNGVASVYCESPVNGPTKPEFWGRPLQVILDSSAVWFSSQSPPVTAC